MNINIFDYDDEQIQLAFVANMAELLSVVFALAHIQEESILPVPHGASEHQEFVWRTLQLFKHPDSDEFSRTQLGKFLLELQDFAK